MIAVGIDIGTTHAKATALGEDGRLWSAQSSSYRLYFTDDGGVEQRPEDWWAALCEALHGLWRQGVGSRQVGCVSLSGHGCSLVALDEAGQVLRPAVSSLDTRCSRQAQAIREAAGEQILRRNGNAVGVFNFEPKLRWLKETQREIYDRMDVFLSATGYCAYRLTGERALNKSDGGIAMSFDRLTDGDWNEDLIAGMGLDRRKYPPLIACDGALGEVRTEAALATGLPPGVLVLGGGEDTSSAALSAGVTQPGDAYLSLGTQGTIGVCTDRFETRPELLGFPHVLPGRHLLSGSMSTFGAGMRWFADLWRPSLAESSRESVQPDIVERLLSACESTKAGAGGIVFLPYLSGELHPILDERAAGVFFGLKLSHTREDMTRAVLEGTAHAVRHNLAIAESVTGKAVSLRAVGGPTRSPLWCQIIADVTQRKVEVVGAAGAEGAPLGNAVMAMSRIRNADPAQLAASTAAVIRTHEPSSPSQAVHDRHHDVFLELYARNKDLFPMLR